MGIPRNGKPGGIIGMPGINPGGTGIPGMGGIPGAGGNPGGNDPGIGGIPGMATGIPLGIMGGGGCTPGIGNPLDGCISGNLNSVESDK